MADESSPEVPVPKVSRTACPMPPGKYVGIPTTLAMYAQTCTQGTLLLICHCSFGFFVNVLARVRACVSV